MSKVTEIPNNLTQEQKARNLKHLYDVINDIAKDLWEKGEDISDLFYTDEEIEKLKKKKKIKFI